CWQFDQPTLGEDFSQLRLPIRARQMPNEPPHSPFSVSAHPSFDPSSWSPETSTKQGGLDISWMEFHGARLDTSGHQIGRVRYGFLPIFYALAADWVGFQKFQV
ncbi:unnamed protein product, partial [Prunus brigantina]